METRTITIDYAGPGKRNPAYGKVKAFEVDEAGKSLWFDCSLDIAGKLHQLKGKQVQVLVEQTPKGYWQIKGFPNAMQMGGQQYAPASVGQAASVVVANIAPPQGIGREEGMFAMAVIGKAFQGTMNIPGEGALTDLIVNSVNAWRKAEARVKAGNFAPLTTSVYERPGEELHPDERIPF